MSALIFEYYDDWRTREFTCEKCGWSGRAEEMDRESFEQLSDYSCPECEQMLLIVGYPTLAEIERAAARGVAEAVQQLELIRRAHEVSK